MQDAFAKTGKYLASPVLVQALSLAFARGWIDLLLAGPVGAARLAQQGASQQGSGPVTRAGMEMLAMVLQSGGVLRCDSLGRWHLTDGFHDDLRWRDLLEGRLWFTQMAGRDLSVHFADFIGNPAGFMKNSGVFNAFRYDLCFDDGPQGQAAAAPWVRYTTALTRVEGQALAAQLDLAQVRRVLDLGGNSGALALALKAAAPHLELTVFDLPAVCALGQSSAAGGQGVRFIAGDLRFDRLPEGHDLVVFKSLLHDWPENEALHFLEKAAAILPVGGQVAVFERVAITPDSLPDPNDFSAVANLVFQPFYRDPEVYRRKLAALGFAEESCQIMRLDMDFVLIVARKTAPRLREAEVTAYPGAEIGPHGRAMLAAVEALDCSFGFEHSAKFTRFGINQDRFVISLGRGAFGPEGPAGFCLALGAPEAPLRDLLRDLDRAKTLHLGYEGAGEEHGPRYKLYLEFSAQGTDKHIVFDALKWEVGASARRDIYWLDPQEADPLAALSQWNPAGGLHPAVGFARQVAGDADPRRLTRMEVVETGAQRHSFDLNLYRLALRLDQAETAVGALAAHFALPHNAVQLLLAQYGATRLGHVAGGVNAEGHSFATIYFGLQGRRGTKVESLLLPAEEG